VFTQGLSIDEVKENIADALEMYLEDLRENYKSHPDMLNKELQRLYLDSIIKELDGSVRENTLTMDEIVEEVNIVRQEMYEKKNQI
jgi:hypothetical protein